MRPSCLVRKYWSSPCLFTDVKRSSLTAPKKLQTAKFCKTDPGVLQVMSELVEFLIFVEFTGAILSRHGRDQ